MADDPTLASPPAGGGAPSPAGPSPAAPPAIPGAGGPPPALAALLQRLNPMPSGMGGPSAPQGNPGSAAQAMLKVRSIIKQMEEVLPDVPMETPLHEKLLSSVKSLMTAMPDENPDLAGPQSAMLLNILRQGAQQAPMSALMRLGGGQMPAAPAGAPMSPAGAPMGVPA